MSSALISTYKPLQQFEDLFRQFEVQLLSTIGVQYESALTMGVDVIYNNTQNDVITMVKTASALETGIVMPAQVICARDRYSNASTSHLH